MTKKECDAYIEMFNRLLSRPIESVEVFGQTECGVKINADDEVLLEPFLKATITTEYKIGKLTFSKCEPMALSLFQEYSIDDDTLTNSWIIFPGKITDVVRKRCEIMGMIDTVFMRYQKVKIADLTQNDETEDEQTPSKK